MHPYPGLKTLREGNSLTIDGVEVRRVDGPLQPGDTYVAARNTGPHLLTVHTVNAERGWVHPTPGGTTQYPFDTGECIKVEPVSDITAPGGGGPTAPATATP